ncbi:stage IV sporulation intramembrane metalloprotease SpoIVFB [Bacillus spizizenii]|uniref:stage IV sporulation intramembrane metalloprotease SpoIVFB n=1 Tax=Bacillus spizizenii TaxID=96241 RepID=UPI0003101F06|nr:stage IV sporulation intramembrane metalloprotease SpoIVFB [Bacillus spizizenii]
MNKWLDLILKIHVHPFLWIIAALGLLTGHIKALLCLLLIVLVHELGHAALAVFFSWRIKRVFLLPFGGTVEVEEHGNRPLKEEFAVIIAGPLQHIWLQLAAWVLAEFSVIHQHTFELFTFYNLSILFVNLLPIWPLDGGKLLFLLFSKQLPFQKAHRLNLKTSLCFCMLLGCWVLFVIPLQISAWVLFVFLAVSLFEEYRQRHYIHVRFLLERYYGKNRELEELLPLTVKAEDKVYHVMAEFKRGCKHPIIIEKSGEKLSQLDENEVLHAYFADKRTNSSMEELLLPY